MKLASRFGYRSPVLRSDTPLSDSQIAAVAPSIYAESEHSSRSERYRYISTGVILAQLRLQGFQPFMVAQTRVRDAGRRDFTKHMLRLRRDTDITAEGANEVILLNSHDGTSSYQLLAGYIRFVCLNSLVTCDDGSEIRVHHKGNDIADRVIEGSFEIVKSFDRIAAERDDMKAITLTRPEAEVFAASALVAKYDDPEHTPITTDQILVPRRWQDKQSDLWTVFNTVQENLMQGGIAGRTATGKRRQTRGVEGIDASTKLNRALWSLAEGMKALKQAA
jgi:hypothetical protein